MTATALHPARRRVVVWVLLGAVALALLVFATVDRDSDPVSTSERTYALAAEFGCPVCGGQSLAESDVPIARELRNEIAVRLEQGQTESQIRQYLVSIYGENIDYTPRATGVTGLVWVIPVVAVVVALAGLTAVFLRWRNEERSVATDEDRALVASALSRSGQSGSDHSGSDHSGSGPSADHSGSGSLFGGPDPRKASQNDDPGA